MYGPNVIYARGEESLKNAVINTCYNQGCDTNPGPTIRDVTIYAYGANAMVGTELRCYGGSTCYLHCWGDACESMEEYKCYSGANCYCDGPGCPDHVQPIVFSNAPTGSPVSSTLTCNDQYSCTDGVSANYISCNGAFSCGNMGTDPVIEAQDGIECYGHQSCDGATLRAGAGTIDCGGQWRYAFCGCHVVSC